MLLRSRRKKQFKNLLIAGLLCDSITQLVTNVKSLLF